jgi:hypothetical protein
LGSLSAIVAGTANGFIGLVNKQRQKLLPFFSFYDGVIGFGGFSPCMLVILVFWSFLPTLTELQF